MSHMADPGPLSSSDGVPRLLVSRSPRSPDADASPRQTTTSVECRGDPIISSNQMLPSPKTSQTCHTPTLDNPGQVCARRRPRRRLQKYAPKPNSLSLWPTVPASIPSTSTAASLTPKRASHDSTASSTTLECGGGLRATRAPGTCEQPSIPIPPDLSDSKWLDYLESNGLARSPELPQLLSTLSPSHLQPPLSPASAHYITNKPRRTTVTGNPSQPDTPPDISRLDINYRPSSHQNQHPPQQSRPLAMEVAMSTPTAHRLRKSLSKRSFLAPPLKVGQLDGSAPRRKEIRVIKRRASIELIAEQYQAFLEKRDQDDQVDELDEDEEAWSGSNSHESNPGTWNANTSLDANQGTWGSNPDTAQDTWSAKSNNHDNIPPHPLHHFRSRFSEDTATIHSHDGVPPHSLNHCRSRFSEDTATIQSHGDNLTQPLNPCRSRFSEDTVTLYDRESKYGDSRVDSAQLDAKRFEPSIPPVPAVPHIPRRASPDRPREVVLDAPVSTEAANLSPASDGTLVAFEEDAIYFKPISFSSPEPSPGPERQSFDRPSTRPSMESVDPPPLQSCISMLVRELTSAMPPKPSAMESTQALQVSVMIEAYERLRDQTDGAGMSEAEQRGMRSMFDCWLAALHTMHRSLTRAGAGNDRQCQGLTAEDVD